MRGNRRLLRCWGLAAAIAALAGAPCAAADTPVEPILGTWDSNGATIDVMPIRPGVYQGVVVAGGFGFCHNKGVVWKNLSGGGFGWDTQIPFVHSDDCSSAGDGTELISLQSVNKGTWSATSPVDGMTYQGTLTRRGTFDLAAIVEKIREQVAGPCDYEKLKSDPDACGTKALIKNPQFWKANGSVVCAGGVVLSPAGKGTIITSPAAVHDCIQSFPPPKNRLVASGGAKRQLTGARPAPGHWTGVSVPLGKPGKAPSAKKAARMGRTLAKLLKSHHKPHGSHPIGFDVTNGGKALTLSPTLTLRCEDGTSVPAALTDLPNTAVPIPVPRRGYFTLSADRDPIITARVGGLFYTRRLGMGTLYVSDRIAGHGVCQRLVAYAIRH